MRFTRNADVAGTGVPAFCAARIKVDAFNAGHELRQFSGVDSMILSGDPVRTPKLLSQRREVWSAVEH